MSFFRRVFAKAPTEAKWGTDKFTLLSGRTTLEVVGESHYQDALRNLAGGGGEGVRATITAVLVPERDNEYDENAIAIAVQGHLVGYLTRETAAELKPRILQLEQKLGTSVALSGVIVGGGPNNTLGVFLRFEPSEFGLAIPLGRAAPGAGARAGGSMRTGLGTAIELDAEDERYDIGWVAGMPSHPAGIINYVSVLLDGEKNPLSRHYLWAQAEDSLYVLRNSPGALDLYDQACTTHDGEMQAITPALVEVFGGLPLLEIYKQASIRHQKAHDWERAVWWADRGLQVYGTNALDPSHVDDLRQRVARNSAHLEDASARKAKSAEVKTADLAGVDALQSLVCRNCGRTWQRVPTRGRPPVLCPDCQASA